MNKAHTKSQEKVAGHTGWKDYYPSQKIQDYPQCMELRFGQHYFAGVRNAQERQGFAMLAGLKLLTSSYLPVLASQSAGIRGMSHHAWPQASFLTIVV
ncbi:Protein GVQW1 [Plecturocebus cupreus]